MGERMEALGHNLPEDAKRLIFRFDQHPTATLIKDLVVSYRTPHGNPHIVVMKVQACNGERLSYRAESGGYIMWSSFKLFVLRET